MEHRLAAILAADAVGYSRLMGEDGASTLAALRALLSHSGLTAETRRSGSKTIRVYGSSLKQTKCPRSRSSSMPTSLIAGLRAMEAPHVRVTGGA